MVRLHGTAPWYSSTMYSLVYLYGGAGLLRCPSSEGNYFVLFLDLDSVLTVDRTVRLPSIALLQAIRQL